MSGLQAAAFVCYALATLVLAGFAIASLTRDEFMPYHREALGKPWGEVDARVQALLIGLMRGAGGLALATAVALVMILAVPFRDGQPWATFALAAIAFAASAFSLSAMHYVKRLTSARPTIAGPLAGLVLSALGFALSLA